MKLCKRCNTDKEEHMFYVSSNICKTCFKEKNRQYYLLNQEKVKKATKERRDKDPQYNRDITRIWRQKNPEKFKARTERWRKQNKKRKNELNRIWSKNNKGYRNYLDSIRRARELQATPAWLTETHKKEIQELYEDAATYRNMFDFQCHGPNSYHVDHIFPLKGENSCGLHVPWNLRIICGIENIKKSNKEPDKLLVQALHRNRKVGV